ncbi:MAG: sigma-54-dependent Fis family transcriptional regulator [Bacteroidetes bacterium]|nr:MAG: sigma-54-dependent Fis family transcriptional regulator [Bacteroidota bacterium]
MILIIDDEDKLRNLLGRILRAEGWEAIEAPDAKTGLKKLEQHADIEVVLCDVKLPDAHGVDMVAKLKDKNPHIEVILLTAYGNIADGVQAMKNGAFDYLVKGDDNEKIVPLLHRVLEKIHLTRKLQKLEKQTTKKYSFQNMVGKSPIFLQAIALAEKVATTDAPVLLTGETGTGKEVFAQAIHQASTRKEKNFVALNCSTFSREILESELFGHVQGAFTGANKDKKGLVEEAHEGTLFLDEIGEMPIDLQAKLLRLLETKEYMRVGDTKVLQANFRLISATNRDLKKESEEKRFRLDLYFRLNVFEIALPALRERKKDIPLIAEHFLQKYAVQVGKKNITLHPLFLEKLENYRWAGNIRELKIIIERAVILATDYELTVDCLPYELQLNLPALPTENVFAMSEIEKTHIQKVLAHTKGNKAETARLLEIGVATLYRKIEEYHL